MIKVFLPSLFGKVVLETLVKKQEVTVNIHTTVMVMIVIYQVETVGNNTLKVVWRLRASFVAYSNVKV